MTGIAPRLAWLPGKMMRSSSRLPSQLLYVVGWLCAQLVWVVRRDLVGGLRSAWWTEDDARLPIEDGVRCIRRRLDDRNCTKVRMAPGQDDEVVVVVAVAVAVRRRLVLRAARLGSA